MSTNSSLDVDNNTGIIAYPAGYVKCYFFLFFLLCSLFSFENCYNIRYLYEVLHVNIIQF